VKLPELVDVGAGFIWIVEAVVSFRQSLLPGKHDASPVGLISSSNRTQRNTVLWEGKSIEAV
jgi:hypothetical protein